MSRTTWFYALLISVASVLLASCGPAPARPVADGEGATATPPPSATVTAMATATNTATPAPTPTPRLPVAVGTALPAPSVRLSLDNVNQIAELGRWGRGVIQDIAYSPDGKAIALASASGIVSVATATLEQVNSIESESPVHSVAFSSDGALLAGGLDDGTVSMWDAKSGELLRSLSGPAKAVTSVSFSADGRLLAGGSTDGTVSVWQIPDGALQVTFKSHSQAITAVLFSPDGQSLFSGSMDASVHQLAVPDGKVLRVFGGYADAGISLSADGTLLAAAGAEFYRSEKGEVRLWTVADGQLLRTFETPNVTDVAISPDGQLVAATDIDYTASVWNVVSGESTATYTDLKPEGEASPGRFLVSFSPAGDTLAMGGLDTVGLWDVQAHKFLRSAKTHSAPVYGIAVSPDSTLLASVGYVDVQLRSLLNGQTIPLSDEVTGFTHVVFSPDGKSLALGAQDGKARVWPLDDLAHPQVFEPAIGGDVRAITFSPDGQTLAFSAQKDKYWNFGYGYTGEIQLNNVADGAIMKSVTGSSLWYISDLTYSRSGDLLASVSPGDRIVVFRTADYTPLYLFKNGLSIAFSPDGSLLAGATTDKSVHIWEMSSGKEIVTIRGLPEFVWSVVFSPDGKLLAAGDEKGTLYIWNAADGSLLKSWPGHLNAVNHLLFLPGGRLLISASGDGTIRFWGLKP